MSALRRMLDFFANWSFDPAAASVGDVPTWDGNDFIAQAQQGGGGGLPGTYAVYTYDGIADRQDADSGDFNLLRLSDGNLGSDFEAGGDAMGGLLIKTAGTYHLEWTVHVLGNSASASWVPFDINLDGSRDEDGSLEQDSAELSWRGMVWSDKDSVISRTGIRKFTAVPRNITLIGTTNSGETLQSPTATLRAVRLA